MITFKQFLDESNDSPVDYKIVEDEKDRFETHAEIGGRTIRFVAILMMRAQDQWDIEFTQLTKAEPEIGTTKKTGSGSEREVFSMVIASLKDFIKRRNPTMISFTASSRDKGNRASLYKRMASRISGYRVKQKQKANYVDFTLERADTYDWDAAREAMNKQLTASE